MKFLEINIKEGFLNWSETYAPQSVKRRDTAQVSDRRSPVYSVSTSDFIYPDIFESSKLQELLFVKNLSVIDNNSCSKNLPDFFLISRVQ